MKRAADTHPDDRHTVSPTRPPRRPHAIALTCGVALALAACRNSDDGAPPPPEPAELSGQLGVSPVDGSGGTVLEQEPNDSPSQVQFIGSIAPGTNYAIGGEITDDGSDPFDSFRFATSAPVAVHMELEILMPGADLDVLLFDVDTGQVIQVFETEANPEVGDFTIDAAGREFDLVVYSFAGASAYELRLAASAPVPAAPGAEAPALAGVAPAKSPDAEPRYLGAAHAMVAGRIVALESDSAALSSARAAFLAAHGLELVSRSQDGTSIYRLAPEEAAKLPKATPGALRGSLEHAVARRAWLLARQPGVRAASPDYVLELFSEPNDTHYPLQWHYPQTNLPLAWDVGVGSSDVLVAVIDTGFTPHPDLLPRIVGGYDFISDPATANDGDGMDPDATDPGDGYGPYPSSYHGTHVSGTVGARSNDQAGVAGVDWSAGILSLRALGIGGGALSDIAAAVLYAAQLPNASGALPAKKADVINMSLGSPAFSGVLEAACADALAAGVTLVAAAGNEPDSVPKYPAAFDSVIAVGAVRYDRELAPYSSFGTWVDIVAPGGDLNVDQNGDGFPDGVLSTYTDGQGGFFYAFQQGTSMATPHVAGIVALMRGADPTAAPMEIRDVLRATAQDLGPAGPDATFGYGLVDAHAAVLAASGMQQPGPILVVDPTTIDFGAEDQSVTVSLANAGSGFIEVLGASVVFLDGTGWLTGDFVPAPTGAGISDAALTLQVDRAGLAAGEYAATVSIEATGQPEATVQVLMSAGGGNLPDLTVYVLIADATTFETVEQAITDLAAGYAWGMNDVAPGSYILVAGTDVDDDGFIGDEEEPLFGMWPSAVDPQVLSIASGGDLAGLDFPVGQGEIGVLGTSGFPGFRRW